MTSQQASAPLGSAADGVAVLFRAHYLEMVRLAGLLGTDDPEDIAQEAFARLMRKGVLDADPAPYLRAIVCNLTRNRHRHLRVVREKTPRAVSEPSPEQAAIVHEDHTEMIAALAALPARRREAIVLRLGAHRRPARPGCQPSGAVAGQCAEDDGGAGHRRWRLGVPSH
jgi:DNA-directed RNA polymerase specialized sigma24 family protein